MDYAFQNFDIPELLSVIHTDNAPSQAVAKRLGESKGAPVEISYAGKTFACESWAIGRDEWKATKAAR
jgi:RimJ/RimL family protein N-acetyltransferase